MHQDIWLRWQLLNTDVI